MPATVRGPMRKNLKLLVIARASGSATGQSSRGVQPAVSRLEGERWECLQATKLEAEERDPARVRCGLGGSQLPEY